MSQNLEANLGLGNIQKALVSQPTASSLSKVYSKKLKNVKCIFSRKQIKRGHCCSVDLTASLHFSCLMFLP